MRTTLTIDDDVLAAARSLARHRGMSVGTALSTLARSGLRAPKVAGAPASSRRFPTMQPGSAAPALTSEAVAAALDE
jgi:hypothetical protein